MIAINNDDHNDDNHKCNNDAGPRPPRRPARAPSRSFGFSVGSWLILGLSEQDLMFCVSEVLTLTGAIQVLAGGPGLVAIAKPSGVNSEALLRWLAEQQGPVTVVSRLDLPTSGVLVAVLGGETSAAAQLARAQFSGRLVRKEYVCLCAGRLGGAGEVRCRLRQPGDSERVRPASEAEGGQEARTLYRLLRAYRLAGDGSVLSLLHVRLLTDNDNDNDSNNNNNNDNKHNT